MTELILDRLSIEVTRRCNMQCSHCLRGPQQRMNLDMKYVRALLRRIDGLQSVNFTGGEPSLVPHVIDDFIDMAIRQRKIPSDFYLVTNGKRVTSDFLRVLLRLYDVCSENEISAVAISNDDWHGKQSEIGIRKLHALSFIECRPRMPYINVIPEGRAKEWGENKRKLHPIEIDECGDMVVVQNLYLNCCGKIINDCDWSYMTQKKERYIVCDVEHLSVEAIKEYNRKYFNMED